MASDLSKIVQDSITLTLNGLLAKDASIIKITKTHIKDIETLQLLKVQSAFDFSNFSSELYFLVPAKSSSLIFNTMMGSPITELAEELDDDAVDAIGEFISNTSGTLTTAINGEDFNDIGQTKFNISSKTIIQGNSDINLDNTYRFLIDLEGNELIVFITFDEALLPYIKEISEVEITHHEEVEEEPIEETPEVQEEETVDEKNDVVDKEKENKKIQDQENDTEESEEIDVSNKKEKKLKIIVYAVGALLGLVLISFILMYLIGVFDQESIPKEKIDNNTTNMQDKNKLNIIKYDTLQKVIFKTSDINAERLNIKLSELTKFKVLNKEELEAQRLAEKNRLFELEKEKELIAFSKKNQEEELFKKEEMRQERIIDIKTKFKKETFPTEKNNLSEEKNSFIEKKEITTTLVQNNFAKDPEIKLNYVVTNSLKYSLFKNLVQQTNTKQARISICNNETGKTAIYIGPFETINLQQQLINLIKENNSKIPVNPINISEEEFNTRCNLE